jgi:multidrug resistance protein, MATE family
MYAKAVMMPRLVDVTNLLKIALPLILAQIAQVAMSFIDTVMVGRLGGNELAGIALGSTMFNFVLIFCSGILFSLAPLVSQAKGAGRLPDGIVSVRHGFLIAALLSVPALLIFWNAEPLFELMRQTPIAGELGSGYLRAVSWGFLPLLWFVCLRGLLEGNLETRPVMVISLIGVALKLLLNYLLIFGHWGLPSLGLLGAGYSTTIVELFIFVLGLIYVSRRFAGQGLFRPIFSGPPVLEILRLGLPIGVSLAFEAGLFGVTTFLMGTLGELELAAHQVANQSVFLTFMVPLGIANATAVRVGTAMGQGATTEVKRFGRLGIGLCIIWMMFIASVYWLIPRTVIGLYFDVSKPANAGIVRMAISFLSIAALFQVFDGIQVSTAGALRGLKDTRVPMLISLFSYWVVGMGSGVLLAFGLGLGGRGLWFGLVIGLATAALLLSWRFHRKRLNDSLSKGVSSTR